MASVSFDHATCIYPGASRPSVDEFSLDIADGEFLVLVGPSGCGKSTTLRMLAGLEQVTEGTVRIGDKDVTNAEPRERDIAMVFQNYALYPHMSVRDNMGFALKLAGASKDEISQRVEVAAQTLGLEEFLDRKPKALSGGQRQRVAMGRAIVRNPQVFLMDEPLSNLDAKLRVQTRTQIAALQRRLGITTVYVTHDQTEALTMGDRIAVLNEGKLQQVGTPRELYDAPVNTFVASFIGSPSMNLAEYAVEGQTAVRGDNSIDLPLNVVDLIRDESHVIVGFRPEALRTHDGKAAVGTATVSFIVDFVEELGSDSYLYGHVSGLEAARRASDGHHGVNHGDNATEIVMRSTATNHPQPGEIVTAEIPFENLHFFSAATGKRLNF
ncbi:MAG: sn-glycerol-3-phosphate ABC transporter ATP-binding protein UgpC [Corynebacterium sp.]|nr:sn-glycerol-3-phosphate ABC transporter ATP-binding protein UgpC [Corynebacterium sp.]